MGIMCVKRPVRSEIFENRQIHCLFCAFSEIGNSQLSQSRYAYGFFCRLSELKCGFQLRGVCRVGYKYRGMECVCVFVCACVFMSVRVCLNSFIHTCIHVMEPMLPISSVKLSHTHYTHACKYEASGHA
jgi:hypothetical protein